MKPRQRSARKKRKVSTQRNQARKRLRGTVVKYDKPIEPVMDPREWDANR